MKLMLEGCPGRGCGSWTGLIKCDQRGALLDFVVSNAHMHWTGVYVG
jgi:hypothetical protein